MDTVVWATGWPILREVVIFNPDIESPWDVVDIPGKGKGAIASRDIRQGELLLSEKPLFLVPPTINTSPTEFIWEKVENLTENKKQAFFNLSFVGLAQNKNPEKDKKHLALAIFETNAVSAGSSVGIFPRMARLNHGCSSAFNAVYSWRGQEGVLLIHAIKDIARGSVSYQVIRRSPEMRGGKWIPQSMVIISPGLDCSSPNRAYLRDHYGFHCTCGSCALPEAESKASDNRLLAMAQHHSQLAGWMERKISGVEAIDHIKAIWKLGDEEGYWSERGRLAGDAVWVAAGHGDAEAVRQWGLLSMKWYAYELGEDSPLVKEIQDAVTRPQSHRAWSVRERMKVGGPDGI